MAYGLIFLALPLVHAQIEIKIDESVKSRGYVEDIISNEERKSFGLTDQKINDGIEIYFGKRPTGFYLHPPTIYGDLYQRFDWQPVSRVISLREEKTIDMAAKPEIVNLQEYENPSDKDTSINVSLKSSVENRVTSSWSTPAKLTTSENQTIHVRMSLRSRYGSMNMSFETSFFENVTKTEPITFGMGCSMNVTLRAGKSITTELHATKVTVLTEFKYEAWVEGMVATYYAGNYKDHMYWALDVIAILQHVDLDNFFFFRQTVVSEFYRKPKLVIRNRENGDLVFTGHQCPDIPIIV